MDTETKKKVTIAAAVGTSVVVTYGLYNYIASGKSSQKKDDESREDEKQARPPLQRKESLRNNELRSDLLNRVIEVESFLKDTNNKEFPNPMVVENREEIRSGVFLTQKSCIPINAFTIRGDQYGSEEELLKAPRYKKAGPRTYLYYNPKTVKAAIVTCGGICPGVNVVIREIVMMLWHGYKVREIYGVKYGYKGFWTEREGHNYFVKLVPRMPVSERLTAKNTIEVMDIHTLGGSILGTSRGAFDAEKIVKSLIERGINQVYVIGGDGALRGLLEVNKLLKSMNIEISLIGIPKTIDNDIKIIDKTFGFDTAVEIAMQAIHCADAEANSAEYGVGIVKVMGRYAGHIAMHAALANRDVNICLIPESPFDVYGPKGLLEYIMKRLRERHHCVIVMSEGVGAAVRDVKLKGSKAKDASGNYIPPVSFLQTSIGHFRVLEERNS